MLLHPPAHKLLSHVIPNASAEGSDNRFLAYARNDASNQQGFSLVELSIVLVILGLLVGGVLTGQSLIKATELRSVTTEYDRYVAATHTFRDKYFALPGDMTNAASFWAAAANGDGDGGLDVATAVSVAGERYGYWEQLALAGLIEGVYTGLATATAVDDAVIGTNVPKSKMGNAGWSTAFVNTVAITDLTYYAANQGNFLFFGGQVAGGFTQQVVLRPEEAWNIDTKMDDGKPAYGRVRTFESQGHATAGCSNPAAAATAIEAAAAYDLDNTAVACSLIFLMQ